MKNIALWSLFFFLSLTVQGQNPSSGISQNPEDRDLSTELRPREGEAVLTVAGGCFWCTEEVCERIVGVRRVISGYAGGHSDHPTYESVVSGETGHAESIQIYYDPEEISMESLLKVYFLAAHDPTQLNRQGPDVGTQYRSVAFYRNEEEKKIIEDYIRELQESDSFDQPIVTEVKPMGTFYPAEEYHQNFYSRNPDNPYIRQVSKRKVDKFEELFPELSKTQRK